MLLIILSASLIACDGESSSNNSVTIDSRNSFGGTDEDGNQIVRNNDTVVSVDPDGNATVLEDPSGNATVTENSNGGDTVNTDNGGTIVTTPDGGISQSGGVDIIDSEAE